MFYRRIQYFPLWLWLGLGLGLGLGFVERDLVCSRGFLSFCPVVKGSRVFYNVLGGSNTFRYGYG